jgi:hypothetical protein
MVVWLSEKCLSASNHLEHRGVLVDFQELEPVGAHQHFFGFLAGASSLNQKVQRTLFEPLVLNSGHEIKEQGAY